jgi:hypothetical protein
MHNREIDVMQVLGLTGFTLSMLMVLAIIVM